MSARRKLLIFPALGLVGALVWMTTGGVTVARGQQQPILIKRAHAGSYRPSFTKPIFILALGSDSGARAYGRGGRAETGRADSIHIIAINPTLKKGTLVGIPRDSYVPIPGHGQNKINSAMSFGGPGLMIQTIEQLSGNRINFDYYIVGSFSSVEAMINDLGGVPVNVPPGVNGTLQDTASKARGLRPGVQTLDGVHAVALARDRHDYARGDFNRTDNQGRIMVGALTKARSEVAANPGRTLEFLRSIFVNCKLDIPLPEAFKLGLLALQIDPGNVNNMFLDGGTGSTPAGSSVLLSNPQVVLADIADNAIIG